MFHRHYLKRKWSTHDACAKTFRFNTWWLRDICRLIFNRHLYNTELCFVQFFEYLEVVQINYGKWNFVELSLIPCAFVFINFLRLLSCKYSSELRKCPQTYVVLWNDVEMWPFFNLLNRLKTKENLIRLTKDLGKSLLVSVTPNITILAKTKLQYFVMVSTNSAAEWFSLTFCRLS